MLFATATVFIVTWLAYLGALPVFRRLKLLDYPERYGLNRPRLPYPTGIIAIAAFLLAIIFLLPLGVKEEGMLAAVMILGVISFIDDIAPLPSSARLGIQVLISLLIFVTGSRIYSITNPFGGVFKLDSFIISLRFFGTLPVMSGLFTISWLLFTINALNWFDGIGGQVSVLSTIGFILLGCLALFRNGETEIALVAFTLAAIAGAGIYFDFPPSKMLIGDTGSMFFGLMLGLLGIYHGGKVATVFLALGLPLIDALIVVIRRLKNGRSPFFGGQDHLHHRLLKKGWTPRQIVTLTAVIGLVFGVTALFLNTAGKLIAGLVLFLVVTGLNFYADPKGVTVQKPSAG